jgi:phosphonate metabolism-associated iron-containing alcohol dehydrogenase
MPSKIVYGNNKLHDIDNYINKRKALLLTSKSFEKRGVIQKLNQYTNHIVHVNSDIKSHPEFKDIEKIYNQVHQYDFDVIVAIGGGSVLDVAKFISVHNTNKEYSFVEKLTKNQIEKSNYFTIPIISIPTTAGTGSEITPWATIWDMDEKKKYSLQLDTLFSEIAIYDPTLTLSLPYEITLQTALDTLSHALESIWNKNASTITINYATLAAKLIIENIILLLNNLHSIEYRDRIMKACMYAGLAFSNTQTALAHSISYYITSHKNVPHGIACSFTLPFLIDKVINQYDFIDNALLEIFGELSSNKLRYILKELKISTEFSDYDINEKEFEQLLESLQYNQRTNNSLIQL